MIELSTWEFPLSFVLALIFLISIILLANSKLSRVKECIEGHVSTAIIFTIAAIALAVEGTWGWEIHRSWPFAMLVLLLMTEVGETAFDFKKKRSLANRLSHLGIFIILFGGFFGAPDVKEAQIIAGKEVPVHVATDRNGQSVPLPFEIYLKEFKVDYYDDGTSPKQFTSVIAANESQLMTSVNHPCRYKGYWIYQSDYDKKSGNYVVLTLVKDPWLMIVLAGMAIIAAAALLEIRKTWQSKAIIPVILVLAAVFSLISVARINFGTMMPALRSLWFVPHLIIYMIAYSVMAISLVTGILSLFARKMNKELPRKLLATASSLLVLGMLCGAVWAKYAWGDYWSWDAKENWAAATWILTLIGIHLPKGKRNIGLLISIVISFMAMQVTWYGVNHLPAAKYSLHTYTSNK